MSVCATKSFLFDVTCHSRARHSLGTFKSSALRGRLSACKDGYGDDDGDDDDDGDVVVVVGAVFNLTVQQRYLHVGAALKFHLNTRLILPLQGAHSIEAPKLGRLIFSPFVSPSLAFSEPLRKPVTARSSPCAADVGNVPICEESGASLVRLTGVTGSAQPCSIHAFPSFPSC